VEIPRTTAAKTSTKPLALSHNGLGAGKVATMLRTTHSSRLGLSTSEAARHLGVSLSTVRRWSDSGYLRGYRTPGGQRRFPVDELDEFVASLETRGNRSKAPTA